ncbi:hypothetical protein EIM92_02470 [Paenibacillus lentus]|uniref:Uncharacterized protein n=1 Tax=Paenibacillus lentus TaxID=1338368 RepID=A0A3Q8S8Y7_9BACL|nr:hypothetical protein EIM92_02470 [Paenibacillus lentus]
MHWYLAYVQVTTDQGRSSGSLIPSPSEVGSGFFAVSVLLPEEVAETWTHSVVSATNIMEP